MVKHQRRSHQPGGILDDGTDDDESDSPLTPRGAYWSAHPSMISQNGMGSMPRLAQGTQFMPPAFAHRGSLSSNVGHDYSHNMQHHEAQQHMMRRMSSQQSQMYVSEGPGVATMQAYVPRHHSISFANDPGLAPSMQSSPSGSSMQSVRSPGAEYTFQAQAATHALQNADSQQQNMGHFHPGASQSMMSSQSMMAMAPHQHQQPQVTHDVFNPQHATTGPATSHVTAFDNGMGYQQHPMAMSQAFQTGWALPVTPEYKIEEPHVILPGQRLDAHI